MLIILGNYLYIYYLPNNYFPIYLSIEELLIPAIVHSSSKKFLRILSLFCHLIESNNILGVSQDYSGRDKDSSRIVFATQLIPIS